MSTPLHPVHVRIKNFQSIDDLEFEVNGFTCITGRTNIGKSAIMRAMSRAILNDPVTGMVRVGQKFSSVEMSSEGWSFLWEKGEKDVNRYNIEGKVLDKTGQTQIKEIQNIGFQSIRVGDSELEPWWAPQTKPLFLLDKSGPQITNFISEVSRLQVYQNAIVLAAKQKRRCQDEARNKAEDLGAVQAKLTKLAGLQPLEKLEEDIEEQIRSLQDYVQRAMTLEDLHKGMEAAAARLRRIKEVADFKVKTPFDTVEEAARRAVTLARLHLRLKAIAHRILACRPAEPIRIPELPLEAVIRLRKGVQCLRIGALKSSVTKAEAAAKVKVPSPTDAEHAVLRARQAWRALSGITKAEAALGKVKSLPELPSAPPDLSRLRQLFACSQKMQALQSQIASSEEEEKRLSALKKKVEKRMAAIQVCPECGQRLPENTHAKGRRSLPA